MGLMLFPDLIRREAASSTAELEADNKGYIRALTAIEEFLNEDRLQGVGWDAMRRRFSGHREVIKELLIANKAMIDANEKLSNAVGEEILIEDDLRAGISCLENINNSLRAMVAVFGAAMLSSPLYAGYYQLLMEEYEDNISINLKNIALLEGKIEKLYRIEAETANLYDRADSLYDNINSAIAAIRVDMEDGPVAYIREDGTIIGDVGYETEGVNDLKGFPEEAGVVAGAAIGVMLEMAEEFKL